MKSRKIRHRKVKTRKSSHFNWRSLLPFTFIAVVIIAVALYLGQNTLTLFGLAAKPIRQSISGENSTALSCSELFHTMMTSIGKFNQDVTNFKNDFVEDAVKMMIPSDKPPAGYTYFFGDITVSNMSFNDCSKLPFSDPVQCVKMRASCFLKEKSRDGKDVDGGLAKISACPASLGVFTDTVCTAGGGVSCWNYDPDPTKTGEPKALTLCRQYTESCNNGAGTRFVQVGGCKETSGAKSCEFKCKKAGSPAGAYDGNCQDNGTTENGTCIILQNAKTGPSNTPTPFLKAPTQGATTSERKCKQNLQCEILSNRQVYGQSNQLVTGPFPKTQQQEASFLKQFSLVNGQYRFTKGQYRQPRVMSRSSMTNDGKNIYIDRCAEKRGTTVEEGMCSFGG